MSVQVMSADSIKVSWTPAPTASNVSVTYYINASSSIYQTGRRKVTDPDREVVISGLHPFAEYHITVQAGNPGGLSDPTGRSASTPTAGQRALLCTVIKLYICVTLTTIINIIRSSSSTCSSVWPSWIACSERESGTLGNGWLGYSPRSREEWHHHILYCPAARHTWCCCPEWDGCSSGPNFWLTSITCSQLHQFEATHQIPVESYSHYHCWNWSIYTNWFLSCIPYTAVEWVVGCCSC